jgi:hypothetical protein
MGYHRPTLKERFFKRVDQSGDCWLWTGAKSQGYGVLNVRDGSRLAHRISYELHRGVIPRGFHVCHHCDTPSCVNPDHLFLGTRFDNMRDAALKGRMHPGERHGRAKLSNANVADIRAALSAGTKQSHIAKDFGVHKTTISDIATGRCWGSV